MEQKKLGLPSVVATGVGLIVATSCLLSIGQGTAADWLAVYHYDGNCLCI